MANKSGQKRSGGDINILLSVHNNNNAMHCMGQNIKSLAACACVCVRTGFGGRISRKRLEIETCLQ